MKIINIKNELERFSYHIYPLMDEFLLIAFYKTNIQKGYTHILYFNDKHGPNKLFKSLEDAEKFMKLKVFW